MATGCKYSDWTVSKLKTELSVRGATVTGRKENLIERLESYDRNQNFREPVIILPENIVPNWPPPGFFRQLVKEHQILLPKLDSAQINAYFNLRIALDKKITNDIKALEKGKKLLESDRINACSIHVTRANVFLTGFVAAAMKKKVSYNYKLRLDGQNGEVMNSHCECPAGKGPHGTCKHVAAVLIMPADFIHCGNIKIPKGCTDSLQNFHAPKRTHAGSPVKAECLPPKRVCLLNDPRPVTFRNQAGYNDRVQNLVHNYYASTERNLTLRYLYPKADVQAAALDHLYLKEPMTHYWIERAFAVTESEVTLLEKNTRQQSASNLWHLAREWRITASRFGDITRMTSRRDRSKLCESICCPRQLSTPAVIHGLKYEQIAIRKFEQSTGLHVKKCGLFVDSRFPWLGASPDGVIDNDHVLEVKCPYSGRFDMIKPCKNLPYLKYEDNDVVLSPTHKYYDQIQGQMLLSKRKACYFVVYTQQDLLVTKVDIDMPYCTHSLLPKLEAFYTCYFKKHLSRKL